MVDVGQSSCFFVGVPLRVVCEDKKCAGGDGDRVDTRGFRFSKHFDIPKTP